MARAYRFDDVRIAKGSELKGFIPDFDVSLTQDGIAEI